MSGSEARRRHGSARRQRHQDPRGARLEGRARPAFHGLVVLAEAAHLSQSQGHSRGSRITSTCRATRTSGRGFSASTRADWCRCWCTTARCTSRATTSSSYLEQNVPDAEAHSGRPRERGRSSAQARGRSASRPAHSQLPVLGSALPWAAVLADALRSYAAHGSGTVRGVKRSRQADPDRVLGRAAREGFTDERARASARVFCAELDALDLGAGWQRQPYLMGETLTAAPISHG